MDILILATATNQRLDEVIKEACSKGDKPTLLIQNKRRNVFESMYSDIRIICTATDFIEYKAVKEEGLLKRKSFEEIWIPSSFDCELSSFAEAIAVALDLKAKRVFWKGPGGNERLIEKQSFLQRMELLLVWYAYLCGKISTNIQSKIMGYKW